MIKPAIFMDDENEAANTDAAHLPEIPYTPWHEDAEHWARALDSSIRREPGRLVIFTDGSAIGNGFAGARAGIGVWIAPGDPRNISCPLTHGVATNQNAELQALFAGAVIGKKALEAREVECVEIRTDSQYAIMCLTAWVHIWRRNEWQTSNGTPVLHKIWIDLAALILDSVKPLMTLIKVKGHSGILGNECADFLATQAAKTLPIPPPTKTPAEIKDAIKDAIRRAPPQYHPYTPKFTQRHIRIGKSLVKFVSAEHVDPADLE